MPFYAGMKGAPLPTVPAPEVVDGLRARTLGDPPPGHLAIFAHSSHRPNPAAERQDAAKRILAEIEDHLDGSRLDRRELRRLARELAAVAGR